MTEKEDRKLSDEEIKAEILKEKKLPIEGYTQQQMENAVRERRRHPETHYSMTTIKHDVKKPTLVRTFQRETVTSWETVEEWSDRSLKVTKIVDKHYDYPELTKQEQRSQLAEVRLKIDALNNSVTSNKEEKKLPLQIEEHRILYAWIKYDTKVVREFSWIPDPKRNRSQDSKPISFKYEEGKVKVDWERSKESAFGVKIVYDENGEPVKYYCRLGQSGMTGQKAVISIQMAGDIPEGIKKLVDKELCAKLETLKVQVEKSIADYAEEMKNAKKFYEDEIEKLCQRNAELTYCLKKIEDDKILNKLKRTFS